MTLKIAGILLIFDIAGLQAFDFPKSLFSRTIEWLLIGVMAALVVRYGIGIVPRTRLHLIAAGFVLATALSALFAENTYIALYGDRDRYMGLTRAVCFRPSFFDRKRGSATRSSLARAAVSPSCRS